MGRVPDIVTRVRRARLRRSTAALTLVFGLALVTGCSGEPAAGGGGASPERAAPAPVAAAARIAFLGDSITAGYGLPEAEAFPARVGEALGRRGHAVEIVNAGVSGDTSAGGLARIDWVLRSDPELLVLELGANDALRGQPLENIETNLRQIIARARAAGVRVLLLGMDVPTSLGPAYTRGFSDLYARIAKDLDVAYLPGFIREVGLTPTLMQPDGIHPTAAGHQHLADSLLPTLEQLLE